MRYGSKVSLYAWVRHQDRGKCVGVFRVDPVAPLSGGLAYTNTLCSRGGQKGVSRTLGHVRQRGRYAEDQIGFHSRQAAPGICCYRRHRQRKKPYTNVSSYLV